MSDTINVEELKNENKKLIYKHLWDNKHLGFNVIIKGVTDPSYEFEFAGKSFFDFIGEAIADNFGINDKKLFVEKFNMACSGTGEEINKITTLHSSSLCSLLFFFNVTESHPIRLPGLDNYVFTDSYFEYKNKVIGFPSNIDVVLLGKNERTKENVILFLESKFSEYITGVTKANKKYEIGKSYFDKDCVSEPIYDALIQDNFFELEKGPKFYLIARSEKYIEGIKQMISHYYGVRNFINDEYYEKDNPCNEKIKKHEPTEILLGEILFDNFSEDIKGHYLKNYEEDYCKLAEIINKQPKELNNKSFKMLEKSLHYSDLENICLSDYPIIKHFYFGE